MEQTLKTRIVSSLEKCFLNENEETKKKAVAFSMFKNDRCSFQLIGRETDTTCAVRRRTRIKITSPISDFITLRLVKQVPVSFPTYNYVKQSSDNDYLSFEPGLFPDLLTPIDDDSRVSFYRERLSSVFVSIEGELPVGIHTIKFDIEEAEFEEGKLLASEEVTIEVIDAALPEQKLLYTQWFHCDCLASYYKVGVFSEEHWKIIENFMLTAAKNGINQILTPIVTPPLDTRVGYERPTVQLVRIEKKGEKYSFGFELLDRWIALCDKCGIKNLEMAHLYTQWGVKCAPKIMAFENGEEKRIFGWDTDASSDEYREFLAQLLFALDSYFTERGICERVSFHISDEPGPDDADRYAKARELFDKYLSKYPVIDALSDIVYYEKGICKHPIPSTNHIDTFIEKKFDIDRTYYCCAECKNVSNHFIAMPSSRNRVIAAQLYKYKINGFLQWGYNFYYSQYSVDLIDPYFTTDSDYAFPAGDPFAVYPAPDGTAYESIRISVFTDAIYDLRAMELCESLYGRDYVMKIIDEELGEDMTFQNYRHGDKPVLAIRQRINEAVKAYKA